MISTTDHVLKLSCRQSSSCYCSVGRYGKYGLQLFLSLAVGDYHVCIAQGKVRLAKWYTTLSQKDRAKIVREITPMVITRPLKLCNFLEWKDMKLVYKRYASLYFVAGVDQGKTVLIYQLFSRAKGFSLLICRVLLRSTAMN